MIDDPQQVMDLVKKLEANLPIVASPGKQFLKMMRDRGTPTSANKPLKVIKVFYMGDEGGISCALEPDSQDREQFIISITHLEFETEHPLTEEIRAYQKRRTKKLMQQDLKGFVREVSLGGRSPQKKQKPSRGFGK